MSDDDKRWDDRTDRMTFEVRRGDATVSTGQHVCGIVTTNAGYRHQRKERRLYRSGVSKMKGSGARSALKIWISEEWGDVRRVLGARTFLSREEIRKWLRNKSIPWQRRRRLLQVVTGTFPCARTTAGEVWL